MVPVMFRWSARRPVVAARTSPAPRYGQARYLKSRQQRVPRWHRRNAVPALKAASGGPWRVVSRRADDAGELKRWPAGNASLFAELVNILQSATRHAGMSEAMASRCAIR